VLPVNTQDKGSPHGPDKIFPKTLKGLGRKPTLRINISPSGKSDGTDPSKKTRQHKPLPRELLKVQGGDKYKVGDVVAEGGMGVVKQAEDLRCKRIVALKVLREDGELSQLDRQRFIDEARITAQLEHPNIIPVHELGFDTNKRAFYAMKFVKGSTLADILLDIRRGDEKTIERYPLSRILKVFQKVCDAIAFAHSRRVVHCDLKPDNVMVCDFGEVLVMDWGLARFMDSEEVGDNAEGSKSGVSLLNPGAIVGTPGFLAPERILNDGLTDTYSDIYSLGAMLYSILTLRAPISGPDTRELLRQIVRGDIIPAYAFNDPATLAKYEDGKVDLRFPHCPEGKIPAALSDIAMKALSTLPEDRYETVQYLQEDVAAFQDGLVWNLMVDENFSGPVLDERWEVVGGQWELKNGELHMHGGEPQLLILKQDMPGDVRIDFVCRQEGGYLNDVSCFMSARHSVNRREIPFSGYEFKYGGYENAMNLLVRSDRRLWSEVASPLMPGKNYHVRAERVGSRLRLLVNNREIFKVNDPDPLTGADRTVVGLFGWIARTSYSRVRIYCLGTPWKTDILDMADRQVQRGNYEMAIAMYDEALASTPDAKRKERAKRGRETALRCDQFSTRLPALQDVLQKAWPKATVHLAMDNDGMTLDIGGGEIDSLEPIRGLPLRALYCAHNRITSLEPLRGMKLVTLNCNGNPIADLEPLRGMPITSLWIEGCGIADLGPLKGMPLTMLLAGENRVKDLEPLRGMEITNLSIWGNELESIDPLRGMPLSMLSCNANRIANLDPLKGMLLVTLNCSGNRIESLEPLRGTPLKILHCSQNLVRDLDPLRGMRLTMLTCAGNRIASIEPLVGMALGVLVCGENSLTTLGALAKNPPDQFLFDNAGIPTMELERLRDDWSASPRRAHLARQIEILLTVRRGELARLTDMAAEFNGHRYLLVPKFLSWEDARKFGADAGGHLVAITSRAEQDFLESLFASGCWAWMGLKTTDKGHEWVTNEPANGSYFVDKLQERMRGPKVFAGRWASDPDAGALNPFILEWDG